MKRKKHIQMATDAMVKEEQEDQQSTTKEGQGNTPAVIQSGKP